MLRRVKRPSIAIVGPGRLGTALAICLKRSGYNIREIIARQGSTSYAAAKKLAREVGSLASNPAVAVLDADLVWFCVPDSKIAQAADEFSTRDWTGKIALHSSGVLPSDALQVLRKRGAKVASAHPLMTFVQSSVPDLSGVLFAAEGDAAALRVVRGMVRDLGGEMMVLRKQDKAAYHAFATMICPLLLALLASAEKVAGVAGITPNQARQNMLPIVRETLRNYSELGPAKSFTGPIIRGDSQTIGLHLDALAQIPAARNAYVALTKAAIRYLPSRNKHEIETELLTARSGKKSRKGRKA
jgi:predicted short-subunit dehydrogenase-like oxidoreductase (DUF2520 family)